MRTPAYWMELDKSSNDGASEKVLYDSVSILISREKLLKKTKWIKLAFNGTTISISLI